MTPVARLTLHPPAKVNLVLDVLGRTPDGYHTLETVFERLDLADELILTQARDGIALTCTDPAVPTDGRNLVVRASEMFFRATRATGGRGGVAAHLVKRIPVAGGLGGGSSDAASTLVGLNALYDTRMAEPALRELGRQLGADVPFFVTGAVIGFGQGRGDLVTAWDPPANPYWHVLVNHGVPVLTKKVYETFDAQHSATDPSPRLTARRADVTLLRRSVRRGDPKTLAGHLRNALEPAIEANDPAIRELKAALVACGALGVLVSGSGPTTFGLAGDESHARRIQAVLQRDHPTWTVLVTRTARSAPTSPVSSVRGDAHHVREPDVDRAV